MDKPTITQEVKDVRRNYTRTPNILFESYPDLHPQEKWLFINLVYLCGARGTRHLSIRYIAQRTGISAGALSGSKDPAKNNPGMLRRLHSAGLIHAEVKKKRHQDGSEKEQAQYHITITDIWQLNEVFFIERSKNEHIEEENSESVRNVNTSNDTGVQNMNDSVRKMNANSLERSECERERSDSDTKVRLQSKTTGNSKTTNQEESTYGNVANRELPTPAPDASQDYRPDFSASQEKGDINGRDEHSNNVSGSHSGSNHHGGMGSLEPPVGHSHGTAPAQQQTGRLQASDGCDKRADHGTAQQQATAVASQSLPAQASGYEKPAELSTLLGSSPQASAKVEPKQGTNKPSSEKKKPEPLSIPPTDAEWTTTTCLHLFDFWRGAPLLAKHQLMDASHCAKGMAANYTRKQVEMARRWMVERDPYWSQKPSIVDVCTVAKHIHEVLADIETARKAKNPATASTATVSGLKRWTPPTATATQ